MAELDPRLPVIVGVGQRLEREGGLDPVSLIVDAARAAAADAGTPALLDGLDTVATVPIVSWRYADGARATADALGLDGDAVTTLYPSMGGNTPQMLVNRVAERIVAGESDLALVCGGEAYRTRMRAKRGGAHLDWLKQDPAMRPDWTDSETFDMGHPAELALGIMMPTQCYPLFENALRHEAGRTAAEHTAAVAEMWAGFAAVAATNPDAWDRSGPTAAEIATVTETNRMVGFPYTKRMVSNPDVDMASAVVVCSVERARALGIPTDRWVFLHAGTDGKDPYLSERPSFTRSGSIRHAGRAALELAGLGIDDVAHFDVYSCFPSAVEIACAELGIDTERPLTTYGGLCFGGGPWNNPVGHALATMVAALRDDAGSFGLVTANGGNIQKHAFGVYSTRPPAAGFRTAHPQAAIDAEGTVAVVDAHQGPATVEAWTVMHERDGSMARGHAVVRTPDGARAWAVTRDAELMALMEVEDLVGAAASVGPDAELRLG